jgi:hypothetical protein
MQQSKYSVEEIKLMQQIQDVFVLNPQGKDLLEKLVKTYIFEPCTPQLNEARLYPDYYAHYRDGQNSVIRHILALIETYKHYQSEIVNARAIHIDAIPNNGQ